MTGDEAGGIGTTAERDLDSAVRAPGTPALFAGPGEMRARCRPHDWAATPLALVEGWSQSLRTTAANALATGYATLVLWGPRFAQLYNDAYVPFLGVKHPRCLGTAAPDCWPEVWDFTHRVLVRVLGGESVTLVDQSFPLERRGPGAPLDEVHVTISYAPVRDAAGAVLTRASRCLGAGAACRV